MSLFDLAILATAIFSGATATLVGFGIGSLLTPLLALRFGTDVAIVAVTLPHAFATAFRCWRLRAHINRTVLIQFGLVSAAGGLLGALFFTLLSAPILNRILGALLLMTAFAQLTGLASRWQPRGVLVTVLGFISGVFGGLAGNQGGVRAAALTTFKLSPLVFIATATATGLLVDMARVPVYVWKAGDQILDLAQPIGIATVGVLIGTVVGERILLGLAPERFIQIVSVAIGILGLWFLFGAA
jgi:hypothetical protein